jgi:hypothetical protein
MLIISADDQTTWPKELLQILARYETDIRSYHRERAAIDRAAEEDVMLRVNRPANPYGPGWNHALEVANETVQGQLLLGYHASRLTEDEVATIQASGLEVLSVDLLNRRLTALRNAGNLSEELFTSLSSRHQAADDNRAGKVWFVFSAVTLQDESGMERFFRSWGGEALYNSHETRRATGSALRAPGRPAIVQAAVPCDGLQCFMDVGTRLVNVWCASKGISTGHRPEFEGYVSANIPPSGILRVDAMGSQTFESLAAHQNWRKPLTR